MVIYVKISPFYFIVFLVIMSKRSQIEPKINEFWDRNYVVVKVVKHFLVKTKIHVHPNPF